MSFFATPLRVKVGAGLAGLASIGGFAATYLPHTVYIDKYQDLLHYYKYGFPLKLSDELQQRAQSVLRDVNMNETYKKHVRFFHNNLLDPVYAGTPESGYGAIIGIPVTFDYKDVGDVPIDIITVTEYNGTNAKVSVDWDSPAGRLLKESFVFPPEAQKYAIAQQIYMANSNHVTLKSILSTGCILNIYLISRMFNVKLPGASLKGRVFAYAVATLSSVIGVIWARDMTDYSRERDALHRAASLSPEYARGAIQFYERVVVRNKALRVVLGKKRGASAYTAQGNFNTLIRTPHMPLSACLDLSKKILKDEFTDGDEKEDEEG